MNFDLSEEQQMLVDSVSKFLQNDYDFETRRKLAASELGYSADNWKMFAELGWLSVPFAEENGGFGGSAVDLMLMMEAFGKALITEPFIPTVIMGGRLIEVLGNAEQKQAILAAVIQGELQLALAYEERGSRANPARVALQAQKSGDEYVLNGEKVMVLNGHAADKLLVTARTFGALADDDQKAAMLWMYERAMEPQRPLVKYDAWIYPHRAVLAFINWPIGLKPKNPGNVIGHVNADRYMGHYMFRKQWKDANDIYAEPVIFDKIEN